MKHIDNYNHVFKSNINKIAFFLAFYGMLHSNVVLPAESLIYILSNYGGSTYKSNTCSLINYVDDIPVNIDNNKDIDESTTYNSEIPAIDQYLTYNSDVKYGVIGKDPDNNLDNAEDNYFHFNVEQLDPNLYTAFLTYDVFGVNNVNAISRSINGRFSFGGYLIKINNEWTSQREEIDISWLKEGINTVSFGVNKLASYNYKLKNVKLLLVKNQNINHVVLTNEDLLINENNEVYLKGFIQKYNNTNKLFINDNEIVCNSGEFETFLKLKNARQKITVKLFENENELECKNISLKSLAKADYSFPLDVPNYTASKNFEPNNIGLGLEIDGASILVLPKSLKEKTEVSISQLRHIDIAPLNPELVNVTRNSSAYRFTPDGYKFDSVVKITLAYDSTLIPSGYSADDIRTYFFNTGTRKWEEVITDSIDKINQQVTSITDHFTDYINGIVQVPESPENSAFVPTMMNDIKIADPASNVTLINPPTASSTGEAALSYPLKVPTGRQGIQPDLTLQYNSNGGSGWLGEGWNIATPAITLDTRWGVPNLNNSTETEIYLLNGEQLMYPKIQLENGDYTDWMPHRHYVVEKDVVSTQPRPKIDSDKAFFTYRKQSNFARIQRMGSTPDSYFWKVSQPDGTIYWYGGYRTSNGIDILVENSVLEIQNNKLYTGHCTMLKTFMEIVWNIRIPKASY